MAHMASLTDAATVPMIVVLLVAILPEQSKFDIRTGVRCALRTARILDFGGGNGLLCRLLRDLDFDVRRFDSHAANHFAQNFEDDGGTYDIVCAFEVVEHFANPFEELPTIFERAERAVVIGTQPYARQGKSWWYLNPAGGQHVFFYSHSAMRYIADRFKFSNYFFGGLHLFTKAPLTKAEQLFLARALSRPIQKWVRAYLGFKLSFDAAARDSGLFFQSECGRQMKRRSTMQSDRVCAKASLVCALAGATILSLSAAGALATEGEFGGECVMGLALGKDIKTDCSVNTVYNGKTYCFGNETARELFLKKPGEFLLKAQVYYSSKQPQ
jgi:YHS domain-containing protein